MTTIAHTAQTVPGQPDLIRRRVTGTPSEVATTLAMVRDSGHLVAATAPRQLDLHDPRVTVVATLRRVPVAAALRAGPDRRAQLVKPLAIGASILAGVGGLAFGLWFLIGQTVRAAAGASPVALALLAGIVLALVLAGRRRGVTCVGLHCGGCRRH